jgi:hypothetical protein
MASPEHPVSSYLGLAVFLRVEVAIDHYASSPLLNWRLSTTQPPLPGTVVIDRKGNIRDLIEAILLPEEFEQAVKPLLQ